MDVNITKHENVTTVAFDKYSCKSYLRTEDYVKLSIPALIEEFPLVVDNEGIGFKIAKG